MEKTALAPSLWIWTGDSRKNHYMLFVKDVDLPSDTGEIAIAITASYHYELFIDGEFVNRGPIHGDPRWCHYDELVYQPKAEARSIQIAILVHHSRDTHLHYLIPAPGGLRGKFDLGGEAVVTDASWKCLNLDMWKDDVEARGWALGYCEDYDARKEPQGWDRKLFAPDQVASWPDAIPVENAEIIWGGYQPRITPILKRNRLTPLTVTAWRADGPGAEEVHEVSLVTDEEPLLKVRDNLAIEGNPPPWPAEGENGFTFDLGRERVGFYEIDIEAPAGTVVEISGAELLQDDSSGRPWIFRKNVCYSLRYTCRDGRQRFRSFTWSGFRYIHVVVRGADGVWRLHAVRAVERRARLSYKGGFHTDDRDLARVFDLCRYTLEVGVQEHTVDCPTREQSPAFADSLGISDGIWLGFGDSSYFIWYLEAFIRAPFNEAGLFCGRYPSTTGYWLDFCLLPMLGQRFYRERMGEYYRPRATLEKGLALKRWYDEQLNSDGLVSFDFQDYYKKGFRNFIDHAGLGMHDSPHPGIDRDGTSCPLNSFFYMFVRELSEIAAAAGDDGTSAGLREQARGLRESIRRVFWDGRVYHDAERLAWNKESDRLSVGTSWQTNSLAVYLEIATSEEAPGIMKAMLDGYDELCRCTTYFHWYFLPALRMAGMETEARELIKKEWGVMLDRDATTTWEGFLGDAKDSLCHPFSTAPFVFLLTGGEN